MNINYHKIEIHEARVFVQISRHGMKAKETFPVVSTRGGKTRGIGTRVQACVTSIRQEANNKGGVCVLFDIIRIYALGRFMDDIGVEHVQAVSDGIHLLI